MIWRRRVVLSSSLTEWLCYSEPNEKIFRYLRILKITICRQILHTEFILRFWVTVNWITNIITTRCVSGSLNANDTEMSLRKLELYDANDRGIRGWSRFWLANRRGEEGLVSCQTNAESTLSLVIYRHHARMDGRAMYFRNLKFFHGAAWVSTSLVTWLVAMDSVLLISPLFTIQLCSSFSSLFLLAEYIFGCVCIGARRDSSICIIIYHRGTNINDLCLF